MDGLHAPAPEEGATPSTPGRNPSTRADTQGGFDSVPLDVSLSVSSPECKIRRVIRVSLGICSQRPPPPFSSPPARAAFSPFPTPRCSGPGAPQPGSWPGKGGSSPAGASLRYWACAAAVHTLIGAPAAGRLGICGAGAGSSWGGAVRAVPGPAPRPRPAGASARERRRGSQGRRAATGCAPLCVQSERAGCARNRAVMRKQARETPPPPAPLPRTPLRRALPRLAPAAASSLARSLRSALPLPAARPRSPPSSGPLEGRMRSW
ncbi:unnamed protein product [Natator depressus]